MKRRPNWRRIKPLVQRYFRKRFGCLYVVLPSRQNNIHKEEKYHMNTLIMVIFLVLSAFTLAAGIMVVTVKNIIHAALWLIASFFTVAAMYLLMEAEFLAI